MEKLLCKRKSLIFLEPVFRFLYIFILLKFAILRVIFQLHIYPLCIMLRNFISKLDEQRGLHESVRDERRGDALRRERVLPSDTGNQRLQVRVQARLQRNRNRVHGRVHGLLRQRGSVPEGFAGTTVVQMQRKFHGETVHREV